MATSIAPVTYPIDHRGVMHLLHTSSGLLRTLPSAYIVPDHLRSEPLAPPSAAAFVVPVIDLHGLNDPAARPGIVNAVTSACADGGLFLIVNHGINAPLIEEMVRAAEGFFELPLDEKMKYASDHDMAPVRYGSSLNTSEPQPHHFWRDYLRHFGRPVVGETIHLWPENPASYKDVAAKFLDESWELTTRVAGLISEGLGKETGFVEGTFGEGFQTMSCNYYPPCPQPELALGVGPHTDQGAISVLVGNGVDGLQLKRDGVWVQVPHVPGSVAVNVGEYLEKVSEGRCIAAEHRVIVSDKTARVSVAVGNGPEPKHLGPCPPTVLRFV